MIGKGQEVVAMDNMRTEMDVLVIENYVLRKEDQKPLEGDSDWKKEFALD
jgi:carbamoyltransferase